MDQRTQSILIMIYRHKHIKPILLENKQIREITTDNPLVFIVEGGQFLHYTILSSMTYLGIPHQICPINDLEGNRKNMEHQVPTLIFADEVLESNELVEFVCDAFLNEPEFIDFESRKNLIKQLAMTWKEIFIFERNWPYKYEKLGYLGVRTAQDYRNLVMQSLQKLSTYFLGKQLQRIFSSYREEQVQLESILVVDIINTILREIPESYVDYLLRRNFSKLIEIKEKYESFIADNQGNQMMGEMPKFEVVIESPDENKINSNQKLRLNHRRFGIVFGLMAGLYWVFAKS